MAPALCNAEVFKTIYGLGMNRNPGDLGKRWTPFHKFTAKRLYFIRGPFYVDGYA